MRRVRLTGDIVLAKGVFVRCVCGRPLRALSCAMAKPDAVYKNLCENDRLWRFIAIKQFVPSA